MKTSDKHSNKIDKKKTSVKVTSVHSDLMVHILVYSVPRVGVGAGGVVITYNQKASSKVAAR